jgi:hypothetical protein
VLFFPVVLPICAAIDTIAWRRRTARMRIEGEIIPRLR